MPKFSSARRAMENFVHSFRISVRLRVCVNMTSLSWHLCRSLWAVLTFVGPFVMPRRLLLVLCATPTPLSLRSWAALLPSLLISPPVCLPSLGLLVARSGSPSRKLMFLSSNAPSLTQSMRRLSTFSFPQLQTLVPWHLPTHVLSPMLVTG